MAAVVESEAAEKTQVVLIWLAFSDMAIQHVDSMVLSNVARQVFSRTDQMITKFPHKPRHIRDKIYHPFTIAAAGEPTPRNQSPLSADIGSLNPRDWIPGTAILTPNCCWQRGGGTVKSPFLYCAK